MIIDKLFIDKVLSGRHARSSGDGKEALSFSPNSLVGRLANVFLQSSFEFTHRLASLDFIRDSVPFIYSFVQCGHLELLRFV